MSRMIKATYSFLVLALWVFGGGMMLATGEAPLRVLLLLSGLTVMVISTNRTLARGRARQGKPDDFSATVADLTHLNRRDWLQLALSNLVGIGLAVLALVAFRGGA